MKLVDHAHPVALTQSEYHQRDEVSFSQLKYLAKSPLHFQHVRENGTERRAAYAFGSAVHTAALEPHEFAARYRRQPDEIARRAGKEWTSFLAQATNDGREVLRGDEFDDAQAVANAVLANEVACEWLSVASKEVSIIGEVCGVPVRCRIDMLAPDWVGELKTSAEIDPDTFARSALRFEYLAQLAWYIDLAKLVDGKERAARMIVVEKSRPFDVLPLTFSASDIEYGRQRYREWLDRLLVCRSENRWPGVADGRAQTFQMPEWAISDEITF